MRFAGKQKESRLADSNRLPLLQLRVGYSTAQREHQTFPEALASPICWALPSVSRVRNLISGGFVVLNVDNRLRPRIEAVGPLTFYMVMRITDRHDPPGQTRPATMHRMAAAGTGRELQRTSGKVAPLSVTNVPAYNRVA